MKKLLLLLLLFPLLNWSCSSNTESAEGTAEKENTEESAQSAESATPSINTLSEAEKQEGWQLLFDGKTLDGWRNYKSETIGEGWSVSDQAITLDPEQEKGGDIMTTAQFENYDFKVEWKISECGNSGIIFNVVEGDDYGSVWQTGPEMQVLDNTCHPDAKIETHRAGDLYDMIACSEETVLPAGEWNAARILVENGKTEFWLNDKKVVQFEMFTDEWTAMIADSKFKDMPGFGKFKKGHIALQDHSDKVWFRNIKIKEL